MSTTTSVGDLSAGPSRRQWAGFAAMLLGLFVAILDIQVVSASMPDLAAGISASVDEMSRVQTSYLIAEVIMIPLSGWLSRLLSTRVLFVMSAAGFTAGSALCAVSSDLTQMIVARALQGLFGGAMIPTVFATAYLLFPRAKQPSVTVLLGLTATTAPAIGPTLGGWLTAELSWHWIFLINLPVGLLMAATVWTCLDIDRPDPTMRRRLDLIGLLLGATGLGALQYVLEEGNRADWFADDLILGLSLLAVACGVGFIGRMFRQEDPLVELRAFANRNFTITCLFSLVVGVGLYGSVYLTPLFLGQVRHYNSMDIGQTMFVVGIAMFTSAPIAGRLAGALDPRWILAIGMAMFATSLWLLSHLTNQSSFQEFLIPQILRGAGAMFVMVPITQLALGTLPRSQVKNASGLYNLMRNLGGAVGLAAINTLLTSRQATHDAHLRERLDWARPGVAEAIDRIAQSAVPAPGLDPDLIALGELARAVRREAFTLACNDAFLLLACVFVLTMPLVAVLNRPPATIEPSD